MNRAAGQSEPEPPFDEHGPEWRNWVAAIRAGDFERAWAITDRDLARLQQSGDAKHQGPRHLQRIWRGEPLEDRRVLVRCYHGLGDTIQFVRFMAPLRRIASEVIVWCQPELLRLVAGVEGVDRALPLHDGTVDANFDVDIEIMEVPHAIRASRALIEMREPYLKLPRRRGEPFAPEGCLSVGLVWEVGDWDKRRAVPPFLLQQLRAPGVQLCSLQRGPAMRAASSIGAFDISTPDLEHLAHRLAGLDLVLTVDTMLAHLSGALGCETWIMLHSDRDWRWPATGGRTFWYPTARLFHQRRRGDWSGVVAEVGTALRERIEARRGASSL